jgi:hypothetical protein
VCWPLSNANVNGSTNFKLTIFRTFGRQRVKVEVYSVTRVGVGVPQELDSHIANTGILSHVGHSRPYKVLKGLNVSYCRVEDRACRVDNEKHA